MYKTLLLFCLLFAHSLTAFHGGVGVAFNTIDETFDSILSTNENRSGQDRYDVSKNRLAPVIQVGHRMDFCNEWKIGFLAQWKYLNYKTPNMSSSRGQLLPNATFSSINIFGPEVVRDFTSITRLSNEVKVLGYVGKQVARGLAYIGVGPALITASNSIYVSSVHTPNGTGDHLISTSVKSNRTMWGGAAQVGYQYVLDANSFINISYSYMQTGRYHFSNSANAAQLNGFDDPGATTLFVSRTVKCTSQEWMCSVDLMF